MGERGDVTWDVRGLRVDERACSTTSSWPLIMMHIRLGSHISVRHTTSKSMLNPRPRENPRHARERSGLVLHETVRHVLMWGKGKSKVNHSRSFTIFFDHKGHIEKNGQCGRSQETR
jgi:hypothetical protein